MSENRQKRDFVGRSFDAFLALVHRDGWAGCLGYRLGMQPAVVVRSYSIDVAPTALPQRSSLRIAFAADFHAGPTTDPRRLREACELLSEIEPDLLLLGGDYVSLGYRHVDDLAALLQEIPAPLGKYGVLGNHDIWNGEGYIRQRLISAGIHVLANETVLLPSGLDTVSISGLDDPRSGHPVPPELPPSANGVRLVLMHSPDGLLALGSLPFTAAFCGHTHGGQIALPGGTPILMSRGRLCRPYSRGRFQLSRPANATLIVTTGIGYTTLPARLNAPSEVVLCTLNVSHELESGAAGSQFAQADLRARLSRCQTA